MGKITGCAHSTRATFEKSYWPRTVVKIIIQTSFPRRARAVYKLYVYNVPIVLTQLQHFPGFTYNLTSFINTTTADRRRVVLNHSNTVTRPRTTWQRWLSSANRQSRFGGSVIRDLEELFSLLRQDDYRQASKRKHGSGIVCTIAYTENIYFPSWFEICRNFEPFRCSTGASGA